MVKYKLGVILIFVLITSATASFYSIFHVYSISKQLNTSNQNELIIVRDNKIDEILMYIDFTKDYLDSIVEEHYNNIKKLNKIEFEKFIKKDLRISEYLEDIIVMDKNLNQEFYLVNDNEFKKLDFVENLNYIDDCYISNFDIENNNIYQYVIFRMQKLGIYFIYKFNSKIFSGILNNDGETHIELFNDQYQRIFTTESDKEYTSVINSLTKRILDGNTEVEEFDNRFNAYSFIDYKTEAIYLNVTKPKTYISSIIRKEIVNSIFLIIVSAIIGFATGTVFSKSYNKTGNSGEQIRDSALLEYFGENILEAILKVDVLIETLDKLKNLKETLQDSYSNIDSLKESDDDDS